MTSRASQATAFVDNADMAERVIPVADQRYAAAVPRVPAQLAAPDGLVADRLGRPLHDLRISVTDRCNFRCSYCMPKEVFDKDYAFLPHSSLLSFEEITRVARIFVSHGVRKIRLTGGEPLLRKDVERLVAMLATLRTPDGAPPDEARAQTAIYRGDRALMRRRVAWRSMPRSGRLLPVRRR